MTFLTSSTAASAIMALTTPLVTALTTPVATPLTTINPCPSLLTDTTIAAIDVTTQYQVVSTCSPSQACVRGNCYTAYPFNTYTWVSTEIPYAWDGTSTSMTTVTEIDQMVMCAQETSTITSTSTVTGQRHGWFGEKPTSSVTTMYTTVARHKYAPFDKMGPLAVPGYDGSGLCEECWVQADGSQSQELNVIECRQSTASPVCVSFVETWLHDPAPSTTIEMTQVASTSQMVTEAGTYTWEFQFTPPPRPVIVPAKTITITEGLPAPTISYVPQSVVTVTPAPHWFHVSESCVGPTVFDFETTYVTNIIYNLPPDTVTATVTKTVPVPTGSTGWPWSSSATTQSSFTASASLTSSTSSTSGTTSSTSSTTWSSTSSTTSSTSSTTSSTTGASTLTVTVPIPSTDAPFSSTITASGTNPAEVILGALLASPFTGLSTFTVPSGIGFTITPGPQQTIVGVTGGVPSSSTSSTSSTTSSTSDTTSSTSSTTSSTSDTTSSTSSTTSSTSDTTSTSSTTSVSTTSTSSTTSTLASPTATCLSTLPSACSILASFSGLSLDVEVPACALALGPLSTGQAAVCLATNTITVATTGQSIVDCLTVALACTSSTSSTSTTSTTSTSSSSSTSLSPTATCLSTLPSACSILASFSGLSLDAEVPACALALGPLATGSAAVCLATTITVTTTGQSIVDCLTVALACTSPTSSTSTSSTSASSTATCLSTLPSACSLLTSFSGLSLDAEVPACALALGPLATGSAAVCLATNTITVTTTGQSIVDCLTIAVGCPASAIRARSARFQPRPF